MLFPNAPDAPNCLVSLTHWQITRLTTCLLLIQLSSSENGLNHELQISRPASAEYQPP